MGLFDLGRRVGGWSEGEVASLSHTYRIVEAIMSQQKMFHRDTLKSIDARAEQLLPLLVLMSTVVKEILVTAILTTLALCAAVVVHLALMVVVTLHAARSALMYIAHVTSDVIAVIATAASFVNEVLFHCLGVAVAMVIGVVSYALLCVFLFAHASRTVVVTLKRSERRKRYVRRILKVATYVGFVVCVSYLLRERTVVVDDMTASDVHGVVESYGKTTSNSFQQIALVFGYAVSGIASPISS